MVRMLARVSLFRPFIESIQAARRWVAGRPWRQMAARNYRRTMRFGRELVVAFIAHLLVRVV